KARGESDLRRVRAAVGGPAQRRGDERVGVVERVRPLEDRLRDALATAGQATFEPLDDDAAAERGGRVLRAKDEPVAGRDEERALALALDRRERARTDPLGGQEVEACDLLVGCDVQ